MPTRRLSGMATSASVPDNGGDNSGGVVPVDEAFSTDLYTGNGGTQTIENGIDLAGEGGLVWVKNRTSATLADRHLLSDTYMTKGSNGAYPFLSSNSADALTPADQGGVYDFNNDGWSGFGNYGWINSPGNDYASWTWRKAPKFFDVVTYTGDGNGLTIPHNLGVEPGIIIIKNISEKNRDWHVYHKSLGHTKSLTLNLTAKEAGSSAIVSPPTDETFTLKGGQGATCVNPYEYVAYLFAHDESDESTIKCGSFKTPADGSTRAVVELGWEPQWVLTKSSSTIDDWQIIDSMRGITGSQADPALNANSVGAENNTANAALTSTGFEILRSGNQDYIYMAIRKPDTP